MTLSGKTAAPIEIPYYLGEDKPPSLAEGTKQPGERIHALLEDLGAKDVLDGAASAGEILIAQPGDVARFKAMNGDGTIDSEGNFQLGAGVVGTNELGADSVTAPKIAENAVGSSEIAANGVGEGEVADRAITSRKFKPSVGIVQASSSHELTETWEDIPGATISITPPVPSKLLVWATFEVFRGVGPGSVEATVAVDGARQSRVAWLAPGEGNTITVSQNYLVSLSASAHTIKLQAIRNGGSSVVYATNTSFLYMLVAE